MPESDDKDIIYRINKLMKDNQELQKEITKHKKNKRLDHRLYKARKQNQQKTRKNT